MFEEIKAEPVWIPNHFPDKGRLKLTQQQIEHNYKTREEEKRNHNSSLVSVKNNCCRNLHISFFFDGTNNNRKADMATEPKTATNITRLFEATNEDENNPNKKEREYFKYYMPGVGTAFPEIAEYNFTNMGLIFATGGENRINWALLMLANTLITSSNLDELTLTQLRTHLKDMATPTYLPISGKGRRRAVIHSLVNKKEIIEGLQLKPKTLTIKLYVYGFSRGAAEARTFVNWVTQLFDTPEGADKPVQKLCGIDVKVEFIGILDTVPSVGIVHLAPFFSGHMDWANGTQQLPDEKKFPAFIKCCRHFVSAHEQRFCFPLDTIRRPYVWDNKDNKYGYYPKIPDIEEVVYPGVHSDIGGGYLVGDQGKAFEDPSMLVSQIVLHDLYLSAFLVGSPLNIIGESPKNRSGDYMSASITREVQSLFKINPILIQRFNAWRKITLGLPPVATTNFSGSFNACRANMSLEKIVEKQMAWMTAWRIDRYADMNLFNQDFYKNAVQHGTEKIKTDREQWNKQKDEKEKEQKEKTKNGTDTISPGDLVGPRIYEPMLGKTQLREGAEEFKADYYDERREVRNWKQFSVDNLLTNIMCLLNTDDEKAEYFYMKKSGDDIYKKGDGFPLFKENNTPAPEELLTRDLFDNQFHDSRAWFMHDALQSREPWASYFSYRMIYAGSETNKFLSPVAIAGKIIGVATFIGGMAYVVKQKNIKNALGAFAGTLGVMSMEYEVVNAVTGLTLPINPEDVKPTKNAGPVQSIAVAQSVIEQTQGVINSLTQVIDTKKILQIA
ncbi:T6SS phospholipase effector Tle1-like catalytic domain-containing protein [Proteus cibi]